MTELGENSQTAEKSPIFDFDFEDMGWELVRNIGLFEERNQKAHSNEKPLRVSISEGVTQYNDDDDELKRTAIDKSNYKLVLPGDLVYNKMRMWQGAFGIAQDRGIVSSAYVVMEPKDVDTRYLQYLYNSDLYITEFGRRSYGLVDDQNSLRSRDFFDIWTPIPPEDYKDNIVRYLDYKTSRIDDLINNKKEMINKLSEKRQSVLWQAVTGSIWQEGEYKTVDVDWLEKIPVNWGFSPLKYHVEISGGKTPNKSESEYWDGTIPWFTAKDMGNDILEESEKMITEYALNKSSINSYPRNTVIVVVRGMILDKQFPVGRTVSEATINQDMKALEPITGITPQYLQKLLQGLSPRILSVVEESAHGTKRLETDELKNLRIPIPSTSEQEKLCKRLSDITTNIDELKVDVRDSIRKLEEYRQELINSAVTGKIDLSDWQPPDKQEVSQ